MGYVVTLEGFTPSPRFDNLPWTKANIEESPSNAGPWVEIETLNLTPDPDPSRPSARDLTTENATLAIAWYRVVFEDADGDLDQPTDPVFSGAPELYRPTVSDVASYIAARTNDRNGNRLNTFTDDTMPKREDVERVINRAVRDVVQRVGVSVPDETADIVRDLAALRAAALVERSYFPEQLRTDRSLYDVLMKDWEENVKSVIEAVQESESGGEIGGIDEARLARGAFPEDAGGMVSWGTNW